MRGNSGSSVKQWGGDGGYVTRITEYAKTNNALVIVGALFAIVIIILAIIFAVKKKKLQSMWKDNIYIKDGLVVGDNKEKATPLGNMILVDTPTNYSGNQKISFFVYMHVNHIGRNISQNRNIFVMPFRGFPLNSSTKMPDTGDKTIKYTAGAHYKYEFKDEDAKDEFKKTPAESTTNGYTYQLENKPITYVGLPDTTNPTPGFTNNCFMRAYLKKFTNDVVVEVRPSIKSNLTHSITIRDIPIHTWFSIAAVLDDGVLTVYLDGAHYMSKSLDMTTNDSASATFGTVGEPIYLAQGLLPNSDRVMLDKMPGCKDNARFHPFHGIMATFIVANNALTAEMIRNIHDSELSEKAKSKAKTLEEPTCEDLSESRNAASD